MYGTISNPTKSISLNFPVDVVKDVVKNLDVNLRSNGSLGYSKTNEDDILSRYTFSKGEVLSLGSYINLMVSGDESKSVVDIEISRKMGSYDNWVEVSNANRQMDEVLKAISYGLNPDPNKKVAFTKEDAETAQTGGVILWIVALGILAFALM